MNISAPQSTLGEKEIKKLQNSISFILGSHVQKMQAPRGKLSCEIKHLNQKWLMMNIWLIWVKE